MSIISAAVATNQWHSDITEAITDRKRSN